MLLAEPARHAVHAVAAMSLLALPAALVAPDGAQEAAGSPGRTLVASRSARNVPTGQYSHMVAPA